MFAILTVAVAVSDVVEITWSGAGEGGHFVDGIDKSSGSAWGRVDKTGVFHH